MEAIILFLIFVVGVCFLFLIGRKRDNNISVGTGRINDNIREIRNIKSDVAGKIDEIGRNNKEAIRGSEDIRREIKRGREILDKIKSRNTP